MKISELVNALDRILKEYGDLNISISIDLRNKKGGLIEEFAERKIATAEPIFVEVESYLKNGDLYEPFQEDKDCYKEVQIRNWPY